MAADYYDSMNYGYDQSQSGGGVDPNTGLPQGQTQNQNNQVLPSDPNIDPATGLPYPARTKSPVTGGQVMAPNMLGPQPPPPPTPFGGGNSGNYYPGTLLPQDPRFSELTDLLMGRAKQSIDINPLTDPIIRPQVDNYGAVQERNARRAIDQQAEAGSPYATGALQSAKTQMMENAGQNTANLQSTLMTNELSARRKEINDAMGQLGPLLTGEQQLKLQEELGQIDASLKQQAQNSQNDQFLARLGLDTSNQASYWDAIRNGTLG